jgi:poly(3-hydroxybutyrate) depolymerase
VPEPVARWAERATPESAKERFLVACRFIRSRWSLGRPGDFDRSTTRRHDMGAWGADDFGGEELVVRVPGSGAPSDGWPVLVFLHGCGERAGLYRTHTALAAECGFVGVAPSGPLATSSVGRSWPAELSATDDRIRAALARCEGDHRLDHGRVYLCGFSQGATHAYGLLAARPDRYLGAAILSPGEGPTPPPVPRALGGPRPVYMTYGQGEYRAFRQRARKWGALWQRAGHPYRLEPHTGGHHFPFDWPARFPDVMGWLSGQSTRRAVGPDQPDPTAEPAT